MTSVMCTVFCSIRCRYFCWTCRHGGVDAIGARANAVAERAKVYFINLKDGQEVTSPFLIQFGLAGMGVAPAGVEKPNTGHHHLLIDTALITNAQIFA